MIPAYFLANRGGIARVASTGVTVGTTEVTFSFAPHPYTNSQYRGLVIMWLNQPIPTGTTATLPIKFTSGTVGSTISPTKLGGQPVTVADIPGTGVYIYYLDTETNTLQQVSGTI